MYPNRKENYCCTGGGGAMSMSEYSKRRLETAKVKADQIKKTEAEIVATACHNCVDGLTDCIKHYKLGSKVMLVGELVADALVFDKMYVETTHKSKEPDGKTVFVIDDEADVVTYLTTLFEDSGYKTDFASSYDVAFEKLKSIKPDVITLDLIMPGRSGLNLYHSLRTNEETKDIPVVIVSGVNPENPGQYDSRKFIYEKDLPKPDGYIEKPVDTELLLMTIQKLIEHKVQK
jgi:CheY-like chemotaxis protein